MVQWHFFISQMVYKTKGQAISSQRLCNIIGKGGQKREKMGISLQALTLQLCQGQ